jgi:hypothetical protein
MLLTRLVGAALGAGLLFLAAASTANAYDGRDRDYWRYKEWRHDHGRYHDHGYDRRVVVRERPVIVERARPVVVERERPVFVQPAPVYAAPMMQPMYNQGPSGLNLNFNIPLN